VTDRLLERITGPSTLVLRRWVRDDAEIVGEAVTESIEHLRPWMPWVAKEPLSLTERRALIDDWERDWLAGGDVVMGVFVDSSVAGGPARASPASSVFSSCARLAKQPRHQARSDSPASGGSRARNGAVFTRSRHPTADIRCADHRGLKRKHRD
jgi:hypothetical protein